MRCETAGKGSAVRYADRSQKGRSTVCMFLALVVIDQMRSHALLLEFRPQASGRVRLRWMHIEAVVGSCYFDLLERDQRLHSNFFETVTVHKASCTSI